TPGPGGVDMKREHYDGFNGFKGARGSRGAKGSRGSMGSRGSLHLLNLPNLLNLLNLLNLVHLLNLLNLLNPLNLLQLPQLREFQQDVVAVHGRHDQSHRSLPDSPAQDVVAHEGERRMSGDLHQAGALTALEHLACGVGRVSVDGFEMVGDVSIREVL